MTALIEAMINRRSQLCRCLVPITIPAPKSIATPVQTAKYEALSFEINPSGASSITAAGTVAPCTMGHSRRDSCRIRLAAVAGLANPRATIEA